MALEKPRLELATLLRPILTRLPRAYGPAYRLVLGQRGSSYRGDPFFKDLENRYRVFYDRHLRCNVLADVSDAGSRNHYILGRYYDNLVPNVIGRLLQPDSTFIDVGANRGVHTMFAGRFLTQGRVFSFEPNPETFKVLEAHITINNLKNCTCFNVGLADSEGELELNLFSDDAPSGCSFISKGESPVLRTFKVPIRRLDDALSGQTLKGRILIKVDTEGFDHLAIKGMGKILEHDELAIVTEVVDSWLTKAGSSSAALFDDMQERGFKAYLPRIEFRGLFHENLRLDPIGQIAPREDQYDIVFVKPALLSTPGFNGESVA